MVKEKRVLEAICYMMDNFQMALRMVKELNIFMIKIGKKNKFARECLTPIEKMVNSKL